MEAAPPDVARKLLEKVNAFNVATGLKACGITAVFALTALLDPMAM